MIAEANDVARHGIVSREPRAIYDTVQALNISRLKAIKRSPLHYHHALENPRQSARMTLGTAAHVAVLEPERFVQEFAIWNRKTASGRAATRNGGAWEGFQLENARKTILTEDEALVANAIAKSVRFDVQANPYLAVGDPEVSLYWRGPGGRFFKSRVDWLTNIDGAPVLVGLKTARDCRHYCFGAQSAKLGYHLQWAFYCDAYKAITGKTPRMVEIVVESEAPHAVAVYNIPRDILDQGREEYLQLLIQLEECELTDNWPGPVPVEEDLTLPSWCYQSDDNVSDLGLIP